MRTYYNEHHNGTGRVLDEYDNWLKEASEIGVLFPGRPRLRPNINFSNTFEIQNSKFCRKHYIKYDKHSPGIFTVQCVCRFPKLIGLSAMVDWKGVSNSLSAFLSKFRVLPRVVYNGNACNAYRSIVLSAPSVNDRSLIVCDRLHYRGHLCNSNCDPTVYFRCDEHSTSSAESVNSL